MALVVAACGIFAAGLEVAVEVAALVFLEAFFDVGEVSTAVILTMINTVIIGTVVGLSVWLLLSCISFFWKASLSTNLTMTWTTGNNSVSSSGKKPWGKK